MKNRLFKDILPRVSKPARYVGGELNMIKKDWEQSDIKMVFAFPDVYEIGMSHLGGKILYGVVNEKSNNLMERAFAPWPDMEAIMREEKIPLYSLETYTPLKKFDVVGFSLQYELSISNVLNMLDLSTIPIWSKDRQEDDPIVVAGGPVSFNPEPFAEFFDAFMIGDGEDLILEFLDCLKQNQELDRKNKLLKLATIEGVYVPCLYSVEYKEDGTIKAMLSQNRDVPERVRKRLVQDLDAAYFPDKPIVPYMEIVHDRAVLEVMRGCQRACRFCHAGIVYRPVREKSLETLKRQAQAQLQNTGYDEISLTSLSTLDYSGVNPLVKDLVKTYGKLGIGVALPSLRVDAFSIELANEVQKVRKTTLTLAPEAGTQRLRDVINKNVNEDDLFRAADAAFKSGWNSIKLYFMLGLPTETVADLDGILELLIKVRDIGKHFSRRSVEIRASLACFVPKAHTPFQWSSQNSFAQLEEKRRHLQCHRIKNVKLSFHHSHISILEGTIARGDRRIAQVIYKAWQKGCKFDGWSEYFKFDKWMEAFADLDIEPDFYTLRERSYDEIFPWDFIDTGVSKAYLYKQYEMANSAELTPDCRQAGCVDCGICGDFGVFIDLKEEA
ncbi:MAG: TIGR03960 family B12-binding radical SAM protein [Syntrophomonas sp.]|nr:TIGR03960 family B12-binding radical SAM protein [Syntrophomonas sp.]